MTSLLDPSHVHNNFPRAPSGLKKIQYVSPIVYSMNALLDLGKIECGTPWRQFCDWCSKERYIPVLAGSLAGNYPYNRTIQVRRPIFALRYDY